MWLCNTERTEDLTIDSHGRVCLQQLWCQRVRLILKHDWISVATSSYPFFFFRNNHNCTGSYSDGNLHNCNSPKMCFWLLESYFRNCLHYLSWWPSYLTGLTRYSQCGSFRDPIHDRASPGSWVFCNKSSKRLTVRNFVTGKQNGYKGCPTDRRRFPVSLGFFIQAFKITFHSRACADFSL